MRDTEEQHKRRLIRRYTNGQATEEEIRVFFALIGTEEFDRLLNEEMDGEIRAVRSVCSPSAEHKKKTLWKYAAAASIMLIFSIGSWFFVSHRSSTLATLAEPKISPGGNKAMLTLANGTKISLEDARNGKIASENGVEIRKNSNGQLIYDLSSALPGPGAKPATAYNVISTPRGGQWQVILPDGSHVWLNAASSLKYPATFDNEKRLVELTGEAYFEVAKVNGSHLADSQAPGIADGNKRVPFIVRSAGQEVEVLGTCFNINAYPDEEVIRTTLFEGAVRLKAEGGSLPVLLRPGQQATLRGNRIQVEDSAGIQQSVAWKNGDFVFENQDLRTTMRQIARWYDADVVYGNAPGDLMIGGSVSRSNDIAVVLQAIELTGKVKFRIEGKKITVTQ